MMLDIIDGGKLVGSDGERVSSDVSLGVYDDVLLFVGSFEYVSRRVEFLSRGLCSEESSRYVVIPLYRSFSLGECGDIIRLARRSSHSGLIRGLAYAFSSGLEREWYINVENVWGY